MSLARLSAGSGYRYLMRHTASADAVRERGQALVDYYAASGTPPGRWAGAGLPGLGDGDGRDLPAGAVVSEEAMARLYGAGRDPVTGEALGRPYTTYTPLAERIAARLARLPDTLSTQDRAEAVVQIEAQERARPVRSAVAGYDLTFTVPKSVSVLWAIGDEGVRVAVEGAHRDAVAAVLGLVEDRFLHTRIGAGSLVQVPARGAIAAGFDHWDTRAGDPNLHTHLVIANKVQGPDGQWRAVDGRALYNAAVACSELYDSTLADLLAARLPVSFGYRDRGPRRTAAYEMDGIPDTLLTAFSSRSRAITTHTQDLVAGFLDAHGRDPDRVEVLRLRQQATLATRPDKHLTPLAQLRDRWRATARTVCGQPVEALARKALTSAATGMSSIPSTGTAAGTPAQLPEAPLARYAEATLSAVGTRRATWTRVNLLAEAARATRALRCPDAAARIGLCDRIVAAALQRCIALDPTQATGAERFGRVEVTGAFTPADERVYTTWDILAAEARLLAAHEALDAPAADPAPIHALTARQGPGFPGLSGDQARAAAAIAASTRRLDVLIGPAGTGKTRTLHALRAAWEHTHGAGSVIGLAPSATAARALTASLLIGADTVAKWIHESDPATATGPAPWGPRAGQLLILDEAAMVPTAYLDALTAQAAAAGAKLVLVGDPHQLGSVDAGGAFALLTQSGHAVELDTLHRFTHRWEADASRALRVGDPTALDAYAAHGRLHDGPAEVMTERAYRAWATDTANGHSSLLLAADRDTVTTLNIRARNDRISAGHVHPLAALPLHDGTRAGPGDLIVTRRNNRHLAHPDGGHVRNGDRWHAIAVHPDGSLDAVPAPRAGDTAGTASSAASVRLPADYVRDHVELGYATTIHRAQGQTVDTAHLIAAPGLTREALYVAMTRGRHANHAYTATDAPGHHDTGPDDPVPTGRQILTQIMATDGNQPSATATMRRRFDAAARSGLLISLRGTPGDVDHGTAEVIRSQLRAGEDRAPHRAPIDIAPTPKPDGIGR